jgi:hypothetical protein
VLFFLFLFNLSIRARCGSVNDNFYVIFLFVEAMLFGIFTICMMGDQSQTIFTNQTQIDRLKNVKFEGVEGFNEVLGCRDDQKFQLEWLLPIPVQLPAYPDHRHGQIFGYCRECDYVGEGHEEYTPMRVAADDHYAHEESTLLTMESPKAKTSDIIPNTSDAKPMTTSADPDESNSVEEERNRRKEVVVEMQAKDAMGPVRKRAQPP